MRRFAGEPEKPAPSSDFGAVVALEVHATAQLGEGALGGAHGPLRIRCATGGGTTGLGALGEILILGQSTDEEQLLGA